MIPTSKPNPKPMMVPDNARSIVTPAPRRINGQYSRNILKTNPQNDIRRSVSPAKYAKKSCNKKIKNQPPLIAGQAAAF
jgi:hypothetical protein